MKALNFGAALALLSLSEIGRADPLDTWTWRNPLPTGNNLSAVTYGNGHFVAVGNGDTLTSADGLSWVGQQPGIGAFGAGIVYGNGKFVAVGMYGSISTSADGVNWVQTLPDPIFFVRRDLCQRPVRGGGPW